MRNDIIPLLKKEISPSVAKVINRTIEIMEGADKFIHNFVKRRYPETIDVIKNPLTVTIKLNMFSTFPKFIQGEMLQIVLRKYFNQQPVPMVNIDSILKLEKSNSNARHNIIKDIFAYKDKNTIVLTQKAESKVFRQEISKTGEFKLENFTLKLSEVQKKDVDFNISNKNLKFVDAKLVSKKLILRN